MFAEVSEMSKKILKMDQDVTEERDKILGEYSAVILKEGIVNDECSSARDVVRRERNELERMKELLVEGRRKAEREARIERERAGNIETKIAEIEGKTADLEGREMILNRKEIDIEAREAEVSRLVEDVERREEIMANQEAEMVEWESSLDKREAASESTTKEEIKLKGELRETESKLHAAKREALEVSDTLKAEKVELKRIKEDRRKLEEDNKEKFWEVLMREKDVKDREGRVEEVEKSAKAAEAEGKEIALAAEKREKEARQKRDSAVRVVKGTRIFVRLWGQRRLRILNGFIRWRMFAVSSSEALHKGKIGRARDDAAKEAADVQCRAEEMKLKTEGWAKGVAIRALSRLIGTALVSQWKSRLRKAFDALVRNMDRKKIKITSLMSQ